MAEEKIKEYKTVIKFLNFNQMEVGMRVLNTDNEREIGVVAKVGKSWIHKHKYIKISWVEYTLETTYTRTDKHYEHNNIEFKVVLEVEK